MHARPRTPSTGVHWHQGVIVTANHTLERDEEISVSLPSGGKIHAVLAGRDTSTDLAVLTLQAAEFPVAASSYQRQADYQDSPAEVGLEWVLCHTHVDVELISPLLAAKLHADLFCSSSTLR